jgi:hypothetical protein
MGPQGAGAAAGWGESISRAKDTWHGSLDSALDGILRTPGGGDNCVGLRGQLRRYRADTSRAKFQTKIVSTLGPAEIATRSAEEILQLFGAGFAQVPGTDTCVKIGGYVTIEGTVHGR